jgi:hypothetical protein
VTFSFHPEAESEFNRAIDGEVRRALVRRFPFGILYSVEKGRIFIAAVMNLHRQPEYWKDRMGK